MSNDFYKMQKIYSDFQGKVDYRANDLEFINSVKSIGNDEFSMIIRKLLGARYSNLEFYNRVKNFFTQNYHLADKRIQSIFNILFVIDSGSLEDNFRILFEDNFNLNLFAILLAGNIQHHPDIVEKIYNKTFRDNYKLNNKKVLELFERFFISRGYGFDRTARLINKRTVEYSEKYHHKKKLRVALLVSGQIRGVESALNSWVECFGLSNNSDISIDVFVSTWSKSYTPKRLEWSRLGDLKIEESLRKKFMNEDESLILQKIDKFLPPKDITKDYLYKVFNQYLNINFMDISVESEELFSDYSNPMKMYYKIYKCFQMAEEKGVYDLYIRIRPDIIATNTSINLNEIEKNIEKYNKVFANYSYVYEYYGFGVDDKIAIAKHNNMVVYCSTWIYDQSSVEEMQGHINLANNLFYHNVEVEKIPELRIRFSNYNFVSQLDIDSL
ncbi:hypothetical protein [Psychrobacter immobilis]|uniref:hypothetical protein n=1 Tax=Psychrobacter immobilis TaxID=498 RepID=UPI003FD47CE4